MIEERFLKHCLKEGYFREHERVLVAVSGGIDSMTLLNWLFKNRKRLAIQIAIAHVNHKQRIESDVEEASLKSIAKKLDIECFTTSFIGEFSESKARAFRYDFFRNIMEENSYTALVTAHHADDQAETIFMRLLRGTRLRFLRGISDKQDFGKGELIRPFLSFYKEDFPSIFHFEDSSNAQPHYLRNRIRNQYLKELEAENPRFRQALLNLGEQTKQLYQALDVLTQNIDIQDLSAFRKQHESVQQFLLEEYCQQFPDLQLSNEQFQDVLHILREPGNYQHFLKAEYELYKDYHWFEIRKISPQSDSQKRSVLLEYGNQLLLANYTFSFGCPLEGEKVQVLNVSRETSITLRYRNPRDQIFLNGHHKKIRRYFIDQKISKVDRDKAVIIEQNHQILGIAGMVSSDLSKYPKSDIMDSKLYIQRNR